jgi:hypothetical protein
MYVAQATFANPSSSKVGIDWYADVRKLKTRVRAVA